MAIKKNAPVQKLDPAVEAAMGDDSQTSERRQKAIYQTPGERRKGEKDRKRNRAMFDLPPTLETVLDELAEELGTPRSQVAVYLMIVGLQHARMEDLRAARAFSRSMRYEYRLDCPAVPRKIKD